MIRITSKSVSMGAVLGRLSCWLDKVDDSNDTEEIHINTQ